MYVKTGNTRLCSHNQNQAMELYKLGIEAETERQRLKEFVKLYGVSEPRTMGQAEKVRELLNKFTELEKKHLAATERHIYFKRIGIKNKFYTI